MDYLVFNHISNKIRDPEWVEMNPAAYIVPLKYKLCL